MLRMGLPFCEILVLVDIRHLGNHFELLPTPVATVRVHKVSAASNFPVKSFP